MTPATTRGAVFSVAASLLILTTVTAFLTGAYYKTRSSRAESLDREGLKLAGIGKKLCSRGSISRGAGV